MAKREEGEKKRTRKESIKSIINRQKRQEAFLKSLEGGVSVLKASKAAGIDYKTIWIWRKESEEFNKKVTSILDSRIMIVEDALFLNAAKGNLGAQIFWLKNRSKGRWKDKVEEDVNLNLPKGMEFREYMMIKRMPENERETLIERLSEICRGKSDKSDRKDQKEDKG